MSLMDWARFRWNFLKGLHNTPSKVAPLFLERYLAAGGEWTLQQQRNLKALLEDPDTDAMSILLLLAHVDPMGVKDAITWLRQQKIWGEGIAEQKSFATKRSVGEKESFENYGEFLSFLWKEIAEPLTGLLEQLQGKDEVARERAFSELQDYGRGAYRALPALEKALSYETPLRQRTALLIQIDEIDHPEAMELLCSFAHQDYPAPSLQTLARILSERQHVRAPQLLGEMLERVRLGSSEHQEICNYMGHLGAASRPLGGMLRSLLEQEYPRLWPVVCKALYQIDPKMLDASAFSKMLQRLHHPLYAHRGQAVRALSWWRHLDAEACEALLGHVKMLSDPKEQGMVLNALASAPSEKVRDFLWHLLWHQESLGEAALQALLRYAEHTPEELEQLFLWAKQKKEEMALFAVMEQIGKLRYHPLREALESIASSFSRSSSLASVLRWTLARLESPLALDLLEGLFKEEHPIALLRVGPYNGFVVLRVLGEKAEKLSGLLRFFRDKADDHALRLEMQRTLLHLSSKERVAPDDFIFLSLSSCEYLWMYRHSFGMKRHLGELALLLERFALDVQASRLMASGAWRVLFLYLQQRLLFLPGWSEIAAAREDVQRGVSHHLARLQETEMSSYAIELEGALYT
ncbi:MAG: hypothetical protein H6728_06195 [Myxococcales bacterium]|nr:hypothetical protein [Myxococcales bacterium]MCB9642649.1 hypothetical protein [Myxococcales bacterium]